MSNFINTEVYQKVAKKHSVKFQEVEAIAKHIGTTIHRVIEQNDPTVSVKIDGLGNFVSLNIRRKKILDNLEGEV
jgi:nucleoid DNA-binding protein